MRRGDRDGSSASGGGRPDLAGARGQCRYGTSEIVTLEALHYTSPLSAQQIRARTGLSPGAVTGPLDRFEARGLTRRSISEHNRRIEVTELTDTGG